MSIGLSILGAVVDTNGDDSSVTTGAELVLLAKMIGSAEAPAPHGSGTGKTPDPTAGDLAAVLGR